jgi:CRISPR/Cas system-associated exonuclease Cas4 (RecB family)
MHVSASQLALFDDCPRKWWALYVKKIERKPPSAALNLGSALHKILELSLIATVKGIEKYSDPYILIPPVLKDYPLDQDNINVLKSLIYNAIECEWLSKFSSSTEAEKSLEIQFLDDVKIVGKIDRVDIIDNFVIVRDLKTGKHIYDRTTLKDNWQSILYSYEFLKNGYDFVDVEFWFVRLGKMGILPVTMTKTDLPAIDKRLNETISAMKKCDGSKKIPNNYCKWCDYYGECLEKDKEIAMSSISSL